jgi:hypothetical protein
MRKWLTITNIFFGFIRWMLLNWLFV